MHIYFSGIGGSGLSALAHVALDGGYRVSGSDTTESQNTHDLAHRGVDIATSQDGSHIKTVHGQHPIDWVVVSSAIPAKHAERDFAHKHDLKLTKRDGFINYVLEEHGLKLIAVSGTHGKTTTTAMIAWLANELGKPMSWVIGTNVPFGNSGHLEKKARFLVLEADEYDRHMLNYQPFLTVIPSLDYDHPDIYPDQEDYVAAFDQLAAQSQLTIAWRDGARQLAVSNSVFELPETPNVSAISLAGEHNRKNAWLAATALERLDLIGEEDTEWQRALKLFATYPGTQRRFEKLTDNLYTDYAHHPREIEATLEHARELPDHGRLVVVYQPHQNTRQHEVADEYRQAFEQADKVYWLPTYLSREDDSLEILPPEHFQELIGKKVQVAALDDTLVKAIKQHAKKGDTVVAMGAGDIDPWLREKF